MTAKDIMTGSVIRADMEMPVSSLIEMFDKYEITAAPVVGQNKKLVGIVTKSDVLGHFIDQHFDLELKDQLNELLEIEKTEPDAEPELDKPVKAIMTPDPITADADTPLNRLAEIIISSHIHKIVITKGDVTVGIVSPIDFLYVIAGVAKDERTKTD